MKKITIVMLVFVLSIMIIACGKTATAEQKAACESATNTLQELADRGGNKFKVESKVKGIDDKVIYEVKLDFEPDFMEETIELFADSIVPYLKSEYLEEQDVYIVMYINGIGDSPARLVDPDLDSSILD